MFRSKVVLIVGAGASHELGFPLGVELKKQLQLALDIKFRHGYEQVSGDHQVVEALRGAVSENGQSDINPYLHAGRAISDAMATTGSIDSFLQTHRNDEKIVLMGKLGIARCILKAERKSALFPKIVGEPVKLAATEGTWYAEFFKLLAGEVENPDALFENLSIVCFNYDRSIEHYLCYAIMKRFLVSEAKAREIVATLAIYHPYGASGPLPWQNSSKAVPYGGNDHYSDLLFVAKDLRTFSEGVEDGYIAQIRRVLSEAGNILMIGFGFAPINMSLLAVGGHRTEKAVYATAFDIDPTESEVLQRKIGATLNAKPQSCRIYPGCKSANLFQMCRVSFSEL